MRSVILILLLLATPACAAPTLKDLSIPGTPVFVAVAKDVIGVYFAIDPSRASGAGLFDDSAIVPSYSPESIRSLTERLDRDMTAMRQMPWRTWDVDRQIDFRWIYATAEVAKRELTVEKIFIHRCGAWLEPTANNLIALVTYAPERLDVQATVIEKIPAMIQEMRRIATSPTHQDVVFGEKLIDSLLFMFQTPAESARLKQDRQTAARSLRDYRKYIASLKNLRDNQMVGAESYAWRLKHAELLPWTPEELLVLAHSEEALVKAKMDLLGPVIEKDPGPTSKQQEEARTLTRDSLLALYDAIERNNRGALERDGMVTVPAAVGPIHARETPYAPTGVGGSMNPPPPIGDSNVGYWNVEHFHPTWSQKERLQEVTNAENYRTNGMGPYAAHEGVPGHHLQLSIARTLKDPIRSILPDGVQNEGWALYAEEAFWQAGGLGNSVAAQYETLASYMDRIHRVVYSVNVERNHWTLQQGADYHEHAKPGKGHIRGDVTRTFNWPTQLISYFSGKMQIEQLKFDYKKLKGDAYSDRDFHDRLLEVGSIPIVFARCKLLSEPVPDI